MAVYVSTSCLARGSNVFYVLELYSKAGFPRVELGSRHEHVAALSPADFRRYGFDYVVHHYFPPPRRPLIVNLASQNPVILDQSRLHVRRAIEFCHGLGANLFTFHAGFCLDPDDRFRFSGDRPFDYEAAFATFIESVSQTNDYAERSGIRIAIENNVVSPSNLAHGQKQFLLLCKAEEFERLWDRIPSANVGVLLDLGHLKVTSHSLGFDPYECIDRIRDRVFAIHLHENNGHLDEHTRLDSTSWCWQVIRDNHFSNLPLVLESSGLTIEQIAHQVSLAERMLK